MKKCLIMYFSQSGTTVRIAESIATGLHGSEYSVDLHNISDGLPPKLEEYSLLGIGLPVYIFRPPFTVTDFVQGLPNLNGLPVFVFLLYGTLPGDAGNITRKILARKGGREVGYFKARGADTFFGYLRRGYLFSPDHPTDEEIKAAQAFGAMIAERASRAEFVHEAYDKPASFVYRLERFLTNKWLTNNIYRWLFFVRRKKCISCGLCAKICPVRNITMSSAGYPTWGNKCILCFYCEMKCPTKAINSPESLPALAPLIWYNIWDHLHDPSCSYVRVVHKNGKITNR